MAEKALLDIDDLRQLIEYDPKSGLFAWKNAKEDFFPPGRRQTSATKAKIFNRVYAGKPAFQNTDSRGYLFGTVLGRQVRAHRMAFALHHGHWPKGDIDHINGNRQDNKASNLRDVSRSQNLRNCCKRKGSKAVSVGVEIFTFRSGKSRWRARAKLNGKDIHLGYFDTLEEAKAARLQFNKANGFSRRHGH